MYCAFLVNDDITTFMADDFGNILLFDTYDEIKKEIDAVMKEYKEDQGYPITRVEVKQIFHRLTIEGE